MVSVSLLLLPAASVAVTVIMLSPCANVMFEADQLVVPLAVPLPPMELAQVTETTPTLSLATPPRLTVLDELDKAEAEVGPVILIVGGVVSGGL